MANYYEEKARKRLVYVPYEDDFFCRRVEMQAG